MKIKRNKFNCTPGYVVRSYISSHASQGHKDGGREFPELSGFFLRVLNLLERQERAKALILLVMGVMATKA